MEYTNNASVVEPREAEVEAEKVIEFRGVSKSFGDLKANDGVSFAVFRNEVHAIMGENGAGKSTIMSILFGLYSRDEGEISVAGRLVNYKSAKDATDHGISMLPQHFKLIDNMTVLENVVLGRESRANTVNAKKKAAAKLANQYNNADKVELLIQMSDSMSQLEREAVVRRLAPVIWGKTPKSVTGPNAELLERVSNMLHESGVTASFERESKLSYVKRLSAVMSLEVVMLTDDAAANRPLLLGTAKTLLTEIMDAYDLRIDVNALVANLSFSDKQRVEILKILWSDADIVIFDEPTSSLTPTEVQGFLRLVQSFKQAGKTIIVIGHKLDEIRQIADRITVMRRGRVVGSELASNLTSDDIVKMMIGTNIDMNLATIVKHPIDENANVILEIENLTKRPHALNKPLNGVSLQVRAGEIMGIAAVEGNGQSELYKIVGGLMAPDAGRVLISSNDVTKWSIKKRYKSTDLPAEETRGLREQASELKKMAEQKRTEEKQSGSDDDSESAALFRQAEHVKILSRRRLSFLSHIPEDRHEHGLVLDFTCVENAVLQDVDNYRRFGFFIKRDAIAKLNSLIVDYDVRGVSTYATTARSLSGGNQQKLILGREIERNSSVILAFNPTRGLDVGAIRATYTKLVNARNNGSGVLLYSSELDEVMQVSDRIAVLYKGELVGVYDAHTVDKLGIGEAMLNGKAPEVHTDRERPSYAAQEEEKRPEWIDVEKPASEMSFADAEAQKVASEFKREAPYTKTITPQPQPEPAPQPEPRPEPAPQPEPTPQAPPPPPPPPQTAPQPTAPILQSKSSTAGVPSSSAFTQAATMPRQTAGSKTVSPYHQISTQILNQRQRAVVLARQRRRLKQAQKLERKLRAALKKKSAAKAKAARRSQMPKPKAKPAARKAKPKKVVRKAAKPKRVVKRAVPKPKPKAKPKAKPKVKAKPKAAPKPKKVAKPVAKKTALPKARPASKPSSPKTKRLAPAKSGTKQIDSLAKAGESRFFGKKD